MTGSIDTGDYLVAVQCPHCGRDAEVPCVIEQVLKVKGREGSLSVALAAKAVPHDCRQEALPFEDEVSDLVTGYVKGVQERLPKGTSMTFQGVDTETGEIHEATITGRGVRL